MSPITDPRWAEARRKLNQGRDADEAAAERSEWLIPLLMLLGGGAMVIGAILVRGSEPDDPPAELLAALYPVGLAVQVGIGMLGLWLACTLWLGGAGPLGLGLLRLAGIYAVYDAIFNFIPWPILGWPVAVAAYIGLLIRLFELEAADAIMLVIITFVLKFVVAWGLVSLLAGL